MNYGTRRALLGGPGVYADKVRGIAPANLIAYWPLWERVGTVADNYQGDAARDGAYTGVALNSSTFSNGDPVGLLDGTNDYANVYSASLDTAFNNGEITLAGWLKVSAAGVWTDGADRYAMRLGASSANQVHIRKMTTNNTLRWQYSAGGTSSVVSTGSQSSTGWLHLAITVSVSADEVKAYLNGVQSGITQTGLGVWSGALSSTGCNIGAFTTTPANVMDGYLAHCAVWTTPLSAEQIASLARVN